MLEKSVVEGTAGIMLRWGGSLGVLRLNGCSGLKNKRDTDKITV
jgi:hypothetical protein